MKFLADECCDAGMVLNLRDDGHDVHYISELTPGIFDKEILKKAFDEERILLTEDKGFGELVFYLKKQAIGVILLRFNTQQSNLKLVRLRQLINHHGEKLKGSFIIVEDDKFRFRKL